MPPGFTLRDWYESGKSIHRDLQYSHYLQNPVSPFHAEPAQLQHLAGELGLKKEMSATRILKGRHDGLKIRMNLDGSAAWKGRSADELLDEFLRPFQDGAPTEDVAHLLAVNDGRLLEWVQGYPERNGNRPTALTELLENLLEGESGESSPHVRFISLNERSLVGDVAADRSGITTDFLDRLVDQLYGGEDASTIWKPCLSCSAKERCEIYRAASRFGPSALPFAASAELRKPARERLYEALQAVHLRGEVHITVRELRAALVYILFGIDFCDDYHGETPDAPAAPYWDRAFHATSLFRQGEVLRELARFDPAWDSHPRIDRHLGSRPIEGGSTNAPHYPDLPLESARRRAFFEWTPANIQALAGDPEALGLLRGKHLRQFRDLALADDQRSADLCLRICGGLSRLANLPPRAFDRPAIVPLPIKPRTPTETAFWVEKKQEAFRLEPGLPERAEGIERLQRQAVLIYRYGDGLEERLRLGSELFHLLMEMNEGYQLGDVSSEDAYANLAIFVQRLVQEDAREIFAWNPMADERIYRIAAERDESTGEPKQLLTIQPLAEGVQR